MLPGDRARSKLAEDGSNERTTPADNLSGTVLLLLPRWDRQAGKPWTGEPIRGAERTVESHASIPSKTVSTPIEKRIETSAMTSNLRRKFQNAPRNRLFSRKSLKSPLSTGSPPPAGPGSLASPLRQAG